MCVRQKRKHIYIHIYISGNICVESFFYGIMRIVQIKHTYTYTHVPKTLNISNILKGTRSRDFLDGPVVKNLPFNTGDGDSIPGQGIQIPHALGHLSLRAPTREASAPQ